MNDALAVRVRVPPAPLTVNVCVPLVVEELIVNVSVDELPVVAAGLNVPVVPAGDGWCLRHHIHCLRSLVVLPVSFVASPTEHTIPAPTPPIMIEKPDSRSLRAWISAAMIAAVFLFARPALRAQSIFTVAGGGTASVEGLPARSVILSSVRGLATDAGGNVYISDTTTNIIYRVTVADGLITILPAMAAVASAATAARRDSPRSRDHTGSFSTTPEIWSSQSCHPSRSHRNVGAARDAEDAPRVQRQGAVWSPA